MAAREDAAQEGPALRRRPAGIAPRAGCPRCPARGGDLVPFVAGRVSRKGAPPTSPSARRGVAARHRVADRCIEKQRLIPRRSRAIPRSSRCSVPRPRTALAVLDASFRHRGRLRSPVIYLVEPRRHRDRRQQLPASRRVSSAATTPSALFHRGDGRRARRAVCARHRQRPARALPVASRRQRAGPLGVVVVKVELDALEARLARERTRRRGHRPAGVVLATSRAGWRFGTTPAALRRRVR